MRFNWRGAPMKSLFEANNRIDFSQKQPKESAANFSEFHKARQLSSRTVKIDVSLKICQKPSRLMQLSRWLYRRDDLSAGKNVFMRSAARFFLLRDELKTFHVFPSLSLRSWAFWSWPARRLCFCLFTSRRRLSEEKSFSRKSFFLK